MIPRGRAVLRRHVSAVIGLTALGLMTPACAGDLTAQEQRGRQLYREGGYGTNITATLGQESLSLPATKVPCASCHGPDGLGRPEAGVVPSDIRSGVSVAGSTVSVMSLTSGPNRSPSLSIRR